MVASLEVRVVVQANWAVEAPGPDVFFGNSAEPQGWSRGLSPWVVKPIFQVKPESQAEVQKEVGLSMAEA
jgi:hypothetical protein